MNQFRQQFPPILSLYGYQEWSESMPGLAFFDDYSGTAVTSKNCLLAALLCHCPFLIVNELEGILCFGPGNRRSILYTLFLIMLDSSLSPSGFLTLDSHSCCARTARLSYHRRCQPWDLNCVSGTDSYEDPESGQILFHSTTIPTSGPSLLSQRARQGH